MSPLPRAPEAAAGGGRGAAHSLWVMLLALTGTFALSTAFRTVAAIMATSLQSDFGLSGQQLGVFAGAYAFAFGALQIAMGIGIDLHGVRRTLLTAFPLAILGSLLSALAPNYPLLVLGQVLIGVGCAPAFLVCTVFIARHFPAQRFAVLSGAVMALGGVGMLVTGTPLAWLIDATSWRYGFWMLGAWSVVAWLLVLWLVREPARDMRPVHRESFAEAVAKFGALFKVPHTLGIIALGAVTYAAFITLRGLWLGPLLIERYGFSLVQSGNVLLIISVLSLIGPPLAGRLDPGPATRRRWLVGLTLVTAALFAALIFGHSVVIDVGGSIAISILSGYIVLQYADVRIAYPAALTGRAMAVFTMAMFLGVALMQWLTGVVASAATAHGSEPYAAVMGTIAAALVAGALAFACLPGPKVATGAPV